MKISTFGNAKDNEPKLIECTWEFLTQTLGPHDYSVAEKLQAPAFSPAEYPPGARRAAENVTQLWLFVADLDHLTEDVALGLVQQVQDAGLAAIVYSSWSHASDPWRMRVVLPLMRPVPARDWPAFWAAMNQTFGGLCDPKCVDPCHIYFGPYAPAGTEDANFYEVFEGAPVDVDAVVELSPTAVDPDRELAVKLLGEAWPSEGRHEAHLALSGGLLTSGVSDDDAVEILCRVAEFQDPDNEDRDKRVSTVESTRDCITKGKRVVGWTTLAKHVGADAAMQAKQLLEAPPKISLDQLRRYAKTLKRKSNDRIVELGEALAQVCEGDIFAEAGNRNDVTVRLANMLGERFAGFDASSIANLFLPSLQKIGMDSMVCPSVDDITFTVRRKQQEIKKAEREQRTAELDQQAARIREAFRNGRVKPYTQSELESFGNISKRWVIQYDRAFYLFFNGSYNGPFTEASVHNAMARELSPASSAGVQIYTMTKEGLTFKALKRLVDEYGTVAESLTLDLTAQRTTYDEQRRCIIEAPCPLRPIKPVYHEDIDLWLQILAGEHYENLKTWIAVVTRLDFICGALFLTGRKSVGKSMLALGLSRLWTTAGPTPLESAFSSFNDAVLSCPLTLADEQLPKDYRGYTKNAELRLHIQATERALKRKFLPTGKLMGAMRTIVAAHDISILKTNENISENEVSGIVERYVHIPTNPEAAEYLASIDTYKLGWVSEDKIAEHALWLRDNHKHESQGRFYLDVPDESVMRMLTTGSGVKSSVCQWLVAFLLEPTKFHASGYSNLHVRVKKGRLLVNVRGLMHCWDVYVGKNEKCPPTGILSRAIAELSTGERPQLVDKQSTPTNYHVIEVKNLLSWVQATGYASYEQIFAALERDSKET